MELYITTGNSPKGDNKTNLIVFAALSPVILFAGCKWNCPLGTAETAHKTYSRLFSCAMRDGRNEANVLFTLIQITAVARHSAGSRRSVAGTARRLLFPTGNYALVPSETSPVASPDQTRSLVPPFAGSITWGGEKKTCFSHHSANVHYMLAAVICMH